MIVYLAGPEVFHIQSKIIFERKKAVCEAMGFEPLSPFDAEHVLSDERATGAFRAQTIYNENMKLIKKCDGIVANITPFRGPHMDPGTAFEIGCAVALGKQVACYTQDKTDLLARAGHGGQSVDHEGLFVEDFGLAENLMIAGACLKQKIIRRDVPFLERFFSLDGFSDALLLLKKRKK